MTPRILRKASRSFGLFALVCGFTVISLTTHGATKDHYATCTNPAAASALVQCVIDAPGTKTFTAEVQP